MKKLLFSIIIALPLLMYSQPKISELDECQLFDLLNKIESNPLNYDSLVPNFKVKRELIKRLDNYVVIFGNFKIAPVKLESNEKSIDPYSQDIKGCTYLHNEYANIYETTRDVHKARDSIQQEYFLNIKGLFYKLLELDKTTNDSVKIFLTELSNPFTVELIYLDLNSGYFPPYGLNSYAPLPRLVKQQNLQLLSERLDFLDRTSYSYYQSYHSNNRFIKGFEMYHDNDVFLFSKMNQDREYTGGFKFSIFTDYFKWRWLRLSNLLCNKSEVNVLTYQSISLGGVGYTPYIRYRNNTDLADSIFTLDRPFASYMYLERSKHRTWRSGLVRHTGKFQVGVLGVSQGKNIQAKLHEDVIYTSQHVHGWDNQISDGGRLAIQANHKFDFLLYSNNNRYRTVFMPNTITVKDYSNKYIGCNISSELEANIGTVSTSLGIGFRYSTLNFLQQSNHQMILSHPNLKDDFGIKFDFGINYRYVVHNAMLEGLGFLKPFPFDEYDIVEPDKHVLESNEIERNIFSVDFGINLKWRKTTVFYRQRYHNLEYRSRLNNVDLNDPSFVSLIENNEDMGFYENHVVKEQEGFLNMRVLGKTIYGFGTLGISWIIE